jgi:hypothetical protein
MTVNELVLKFPLWNLRYLSVSVGAELGREGIKYIESVSKRNRICYKITDFLEIYYDIDSMLITLRKSDYNFSWEYVAVFNLKSNIFHCNDRNLTS